MMMVMLNLHDAPRPGQSHETLRRNGLVDAPLVALFDSSDTAWAAVRHTGAQVLRDRSTGVLMLAPSGGLRERLYAAGALLVVG
jgi:hypothetical protein